MAGALIISLFAVLCLVCISEVKAGDSCAAYVDSSIKVVSYQECGALSSCGGTCSNRYCIVAGGLDQSQFMCIINNLYFIIGVGIAISLVLLGAIIACCRTCCRKCCIAASTVI
ncbi:hypothetical protein GDO81_018172 [Engystomops pustulosus]|uniref:Shisa N-terminal domain-containing protein n=1 Tax=Engystomops pustulosus TaxID=76066 RepID=A0AAV7ADD5_ENGPU|nr:hypothetical protein GDO81_018172 [Engystomops pustulosus]